jgi:hypothetical protein
MKLANAIEGGITGATTLSLIQEALHKIDPKAPRAKLLNSPGIIKRIKKQSKKKGGVSNKLYINLASELLSNAAYFGLTALGKKKNAVLRGGILGAAAGLGSAFLNDDKSEESKASINNKILTVTLYTAGGMLAGAAIKKINKKNKKRK